MDPSIANVLFDDHSGCLLSNILKAELSRGNKPPNPMSDSRFSAEFKLSFFTRFVKPSADVLLLVAIFILFC